MRHRFGMSTRNLRTSEIIMQNVSADFIEIRNLKENFPLLAEYLVAN